MVLIVWSILLKAPLEQPANRSVTPNPSKAPWYFLGSAGDAGLLRSVARGRGAAGLIIVGLMAIPYIDKNPKGNGYYTFAERKAEVTIFLFGFVILWSSLIVLGTFLRGPNWNFFGPFEYWDIHKLEALTNVNLSEYIWVLALRRGLPSNWFIREIFGILLVLAYVFALPVLLARGVFKHYYEKLGRTALLRVGVSVSDDDVVADQDAPALDLQPEVHRRDSGVFLQHLGRRAHYG